MHAFPSQTLYMFSLFKKKDPCIVLEKRYRALLEEAHRLSTTDRKASDLKRAEAEAVLAKIEALPAGGA